MLLAETEAGDQMPLNTLLFIIVASLCGGGKGVNVNRKAKNEKENQGQGVEEKIKIRKRNEPIIKYQTNQKTKRGPLSSIICLLFLNH